jgi:glycosyltransferase A (GT-A) superfamily protein (DUF2064 family)
VDLVVVGANARAAAATMEAVRRGLRVLVVMRGRGAGFGRRLRRSLRAVGEGLQRQVHILTGVEVACVAGVHSVEAVVIRRIRSGRLVGVNAAEILDLVGRG